MTVRQIGHQTFNVPKDIVAQQTDLVLRLNPAYRNLREITKGTIFSVNVKPNILLLGTDMTIVLDGNDSETTVTITTTSQALIIGDIGGMYYRYVRDFLSALHDGLRANQGGTVVSSTAVYGMKTDGIGVALLIVLVLLSIWISLVLYSSLLQVFAVLILLAVMVNLVRMLRGGRFLP